jgi:putative ABC transport system substrate-binding protein
LKAEFGMHGQSMKRREFITLVGGAAAVGWPLAVNAQQGAKRPTIGFLGDSTPLAESERVAAFARQLYDLGWIEGRTIAIEYRWADGRSDRLAEIAAEFARLKVDIIVAGGTPAVMAAKHAAPVVPIVFAAVGDPVGVGFVASLARPGGNVTGLSSLTADLAGKRLDLLREAVPGLQRLAIMGNASNPVVLMELGELQTAARPLGLQLHTLEIRRPQDVASALDAVKGRAGSPAPTRSLTETSRIHHASRRRGCVAACCAGARARARTADRRSNGIR